MKGVIAGLTITDRSAVTAPDGACWSVKVVSLGGYGGKTALFRPRQEVFRTTDAEPDGDGQLAWSENDFDVALPVPPPLPSKTTATKSDALPLLEWRRVEGCVLFQVKTHTLRAQRRLVVRG